MQLPLVGTISTIPKLVGLTAAVVCGYRLLERNRVRDYLMLVWEINPPKNSSFLIRLAENDPEAADNTSSPELNRSDAFRYATQAAKRIVPLFSLKNNSFYPY